MQAVTAMEITYYRIPLALVTSFNYLGIFLSLSNENCPPVVQNLQQELQKWAQLPRVLSREGADSYTLG